MDYTHVLNPSDPEQMLRAMEREGWRLLDIVCGIKDEVWVFGREDRVVVRDLNPLPTYPPKPTWTFPIPESPVTTTCSDAMPR